MINNSISTPSNFKSILIVKSAIFIFTLLVIFLAKTYGIAFGNKNDPMKDPFMDDLSIINAAVNSNKSLARFL